MMNRPFLSVIIPCRNEARFLPQCLHSIFASDYPADRMEVLIADGDSDDGTREYIEGFIRERLKQQDTRPRLIDNPQLITPVALNRAIDASRGDVIARVDAHATVPPDYFSQCVTFLERSGADNVGGAMCTVAQEDGRFSDAIVAVLSHRFGVGNSYFRIGSNEPRWVDTVFGGCWRREVFNRVGRFHPDLKRSQDIEFSLRLKRAGGRTLLVPTIRTNYYARTSLKSFVRHNFTNGVWAIMPFVYSDVIPVSLRHLIPLAFVMALVAGFIALPSTPWLLTLVSVPYCLANGWSSLAVIAHGRKRSLLWTPLVFFLLHTSYGLGSVAGAVQACWKLRLRIPKTKEKSCIPQL